jgi:hypothetical protein
MRLARGLSDRGRRSVELIKSIDIGKPVVQRVRQSIEARLGSSAWLMCDHCAGSQGLGRLTAVVEVRAAGPVHLDQS